MLLISLFIATLFLAYANGANDNFKGVATLFGSRTTSYQTAILWATFTTFAGGLTATYFGRSIVKEFTGRGILPNAIASHPEFHIAVVVATAATLLLATLLGFPISTTHCLIGAILGAGLVAIGLQVKFAILLNHFILPLFISPILAIPIAAGIYSLIAYIKTKFALRISHQILDICHYISAGIFGFARGFNETSKIASLILIIDYFSVQGGMITIAMAMGLGGLISSQKIAETMSIKISSLNRTQSLTANIINSAFLILASNFALPISTSHIAACSIFGVGFVDNKANIYVFSQVILAWILTLPTATIISGITYRLLQG